MDTLQADRSAIPPILGLLMDRNVDAAFPIAKKGQELLDLLESMRTPPEPAVSIDDGSDLMPMAVATFDRELDIAIERLEEALMWAAAHIAQ